MGLLVSLRLPIGPPTIATLDLTVHYHLDTQLTSPLSAEIENGPVPSPLGTFR